MEEAAAVVEEQVEWWGGPCSDWPAACRRSPTSDFTIFCTKQMRDEITARDNHYDNRCQVRCGRGHGTTEDDPPQSVCLSTTSRKHQRDDLRSDLTLPPRSPPHRRGYRGPSSPQSLAKKRVNHNNNVEITATTRTGHKVLCDICRNHRY